MRYVSPALLAFLVAVAAFCADTYTYWP